MMPYLRTALIITCAEWNEPFTVELEQRVETQLMFVFTRYALHKVNTQLSSASHADIHRIIRPEAGEHHAPLTPLAAAVLTEMHAAVMGMPA